MAGAGARIGCSEMSGFSAWRVTRCTSGRVSDTSAMHAPRPYSMSATARLFVKRGNDFVRVSTFSSTTVDAPLVQPSIPPFRNHRNCGRGAECDRPTKSYAIWRTQPGAWQRSPGTLKGCHSQLMERPSGHKSRRRHRTNLPIWLWNLVDSSPNSSLLKAKVAAPNTRGQLAINASAGRSGRFSSWAQSWATCARR